MFHKAIKDICNRNNVTLAELGKNIGKSRQYMSELSRGNIRLTYEMAVKIALFFNMKPDDIFFGYRVR
ncbi:MAG: helix-turn-helix transcriptional regulator [Tissierellales bacterium]|jgi:putative transcriptional regulator|nr:helix-turn-helix transcriptional regulator [Tissierellales bacterium]